MRPLTCLLAAGLFAVACPQADAASLAYGEAFDTLYRIDLDTHTAEPVGEAGFLGNRRIGNISGVTTTADGTVYAVSGSLKSLLRIRLDTGSADVVGSLGLDDQGSGQFDALDLGMTVDCDGTLWLASGVLQKLWRVDPATGATRLVGSTGHPISGLVARDDLLYGTGGLGDDTLYRIDKSTAAAVAIGGFGPELTHWVNSVSMSFDAGGTLWAVINYVPPEHDGETPADWSDLATIDPLTGRVHVIGPITGPESLRQVGMKGFTIMAPACLAGAQPVGAPALGPFALLALAGLLVLAVGRVHRRA